MKLSIVIIFLCFSVITFTTADAPKSRPDSHAPIGVMGDHAHYTGEVMLSYRFMAMDMPGLQSGTTALETTDVLKDFMMAPTQMGMRMHMLGAMFAPHNKITLMAMTSYQQRHMEMQGAHHHQEGHHGHPIGPHEMSSAGIGDAKLEAVLTLSTKPHLTFFGNIGVSLPTGSIEQKGDNGQLLPYPMQLGSGSFEAHPGVTLFGSQGNWSYGSIKGLTRLISFTHQMAPNQKRRSNVIANNTRKTTLTTFQTCQLFRFAVKLFCEMRQCIVNRRAE